MYKLFPFQVIILPLYRSLFFGREIHVHPDFFARFIHSSPDILLIIFVIMAFDHHMSARGKSANGIANCFLKRNRFRSNFTTKMIIPLYR
jgi:hypothetical protein